MESFLEIDTFSVSVTNFVIFPATRCRAWRFGSLKTHNQQCVFESSFYYMARDRWRLRKLIHCEGENLVKSYHSMWFTMFRSFDSNDGIRVSILVLRHCMQWNGIDPEVQEAKGLMGLKVHEGVVKPADFLEWRCAVLSVRWSLILTWWSGWKKDLRLPNNVFSNSDRNLSMMELCRRHSIRRCASLIF